MFASFIKSGVLGLGLILGLAAQAAPARAAMTLTSAVPVQIHVDSVPLAASPVLFVDLRSWVGNRSRMIQVALVAVALGIFILHRK